MIRIYELTAEELEIALKLNELRKEAERIVEKIRLGYRCFGVMQDKIKLWDDNCNAEYLTHSGVWQARYLHEAYDVECNVDRVYELLKNEYLIRIGEREHNYEEEREATCFLAFVSRIPEEKAQDWWIE